MAARSVTIVLLLALTSCSTPREMVRPAPLAPPEIRVLFGGDVMLSRHVGQLARLNADPSFPVRDVAEVLAPADIAFVNLESPFSDRGPVAESNMVFQAAPGTIDGLVLAGIDVVSTANNHARDCGSHGLTYTLEWLAWNNILAAGTADSKESLAEGVVLVRGGVRFGFLGYTYDQSNGNYAAPDERVAVMNVAGMKAEVERLRGRADVVIVSMHAGVEYSPQPNRQQVEFARAAIDAGARVVVGHHPHVAQPVEKYKDGVIFYSLGNLIFDQFQRQETQQGWLAEAVFRGAKLERYSTLPVDIRNTVPQVRQPQAASLTGSR